MKKKTRIKSNIDRFKSKAEHIRESYNNSAETYDTRYEHIQFVKYALLIPNIIRKDNYTPNKIKPLDSEITIESTVLDVGGGGGLFIKFLILFQMYLKDRIIGSNIVDQNSTDYLIQEHSENLIFLYEYIISKIIYPEIVTHQITFNLPALIICDISFDMLVQVERFLSETRNANSSLYGKVECDATYLPFRNNSFPTITSFTVIQNLEDPQTALKELNRVSLENAHFLISILQKIGPKTHTIDLISTLKRQIHTIILNDDRIDELKVLIKTLERKYQLFFEKNPIHEFLNSEDYLFWI